MTTYGIDVSHYQSALDWSRIRQTGVRFSIARASIGLMVDNMFPRHTAGAKAAGLEVGAYHYLHPGVDAGDAVRTFLRVTGRPLTGLAAALDVEEKGTTWGQAKAWAREFRRLAPGHPLGIYINRSDWIRIGKPRLVDDFDYLWLAYWPAGGYPGDGAAKWDERMGGFKPAIWQYGVRPAAGRRLDGDAYLGSISQFHSRFCIPDVNIPDTSTGDAMQPLELESLDPVLVDLEVGTQVFNPDGTPLTKMSVATTKPSPYGAVIGGLHYRLFYVKSGGSLKLAMARKNAITETPVPTATDITPFSQADLDDASAAGAEAEKTRLRTLLQL